MKNLAYKDLDVATFKKHLNEDPDAVLIDVRTPGENIEKAIPDSSLINIMGSGFERQVDQLDPEKSYYIYCRSGNRSGTACSYMSGKGFKKLYNLKGGIIAWESFSSN